MTTSRFICGRKSVCHIVGQNISTLGFCSRSNRYLNLNYLNTNDITADALTKLLLAPKHEKFCKGLGLEFGRQPRLRNVEC